MKAQPLGCMSDALNSASAGFEVLQRQLNDCTNNVEQLQRIVSEKSGENTAFSVSVTSLTVRKVELLFFVDFL